MKTQNSPQSAVRSVPSSIAGLAKKIIIKKMQCGAKKGRRYKREK
jgi:hypothetical protein